MTQKPTISREVHYVLADGRHRSATVVNAWPGSSIVNLTVHLDGMNDVQTERQQDGALSGELVRVGFCDPALIPPMSGALALAPLTLSVGSAAQNETAHLPGTWHWPEREDSA